MRSVKTSTHYGLTAGRAFAECLFAFEDAVLTRTSDVENTHIVSGALRPAEAANLQLATSAVASVASRVEGAPEIVAVVPN